MLFCVYFLFFFSSVTLLTFCLEKKKKRFQVFCQVTDKKKDHCSRSQSKISDLYWIEWKSLLIVYWEQINVRIFCRNTNHWRIEDRIEKFTQSGKIKLLTDPASVKLLKTTHNRCVASSCLWAPPTSLKHALEEMIRSLEGSPARPVLGH